MNDINIDLIKKNVREIFENSKLKQSQFADVLETTQSNLSKLLSKNNSTCFTLNQLFKISQKFNISLDQLVGGIELSTNLSSSDNIRQLCALIAKLLREDYLSVHIASIEEDNAYREETDDVGDKIGMYYKTTETNTYLTLFFSNYHKLVTHFDSQEDFEEEKAVLRDCGNDHEINRKINNFLSTYTQLYQLYSSGQLSADAFADMESALISNIK